MKNRDKIKQKANNKNQLNESSELDLSQNSWKNIKVCLNLIHNAPFFCFFIYMFLFEVKIFVLLIYKKLVINNLKFVKTCSLYLYAIELYMKACN